MVRSKDFYSDFEGEIDHIDSMFSKKTEDIDPGEENTIASMERQQTRLENQKMQIQQDIENKQEQMQDLNDQINRLQARIAQIKIS